MPHDQEFGSAYLVVAEGDGFLPGGLFGTLELAKGNAERKAGSPLAWEKRGGIHEAWVAPGFTILRMEIER